MTQDQRIKLDLVLNECIYKDNKIHFLLKKWTHKMVDKIKAELKEIERKLIEEAAKKVVKKMKKSTRKNKLRLVPDLDRKVREVM